MFRVSLVAAALSGAHASKLFAVNASNVVGGDDGQLLELDLDSQTVRTVVGGLEPGLEWIRPSIVCGQKWYSLPANFPFGVNLATVDLATGTYEGNRPLTFMPFALKCGKADNELLVVDGSGSPPQFSLVKMDVETLETQTIGEFPDVFWDGWLSNFHFSDTELQAAWAVKGKLESTATKGEVFRMNIETGEITMHKQVNSCTGCPSVPYHLEHSGGNDKGHGVFSKEEGRNELSFCEVDYSGSDVKVSNCKKDSDNGWWASGRPPVTCDGDKLNYFANVYGKTSSYASIFGADMDTGDLKDVIHLSGSGYVGEEPEYYVGSMTCSPATTTVV